MDNERKTMKQILKFVLDNPTFEKWELYKGMIPMLDDVCSKEGLYIESRVPIDDERSMVVTSYANDETCIINASVKVILLMQAHGLSATVVDAKRIRNPQNIQIRLSYLLRVGYQTNENLKMWQNLSQTVDLFAGERSVKLDREWDLSKFTMILTASFTDIIAWTQVAYYKGHLYGNNKLFIDVKGYGTVLKK